MKNHKQKNLPTAARLLSRSQSAAQSVCLNEASSRNLSTGKTTSKRSG